MFLLASQIIFLLKVEFLSIVRLLNFIFDVEMSVGTERDQVVNEKLESIRKEYNYRVNYDALHKHVCAHLRAFTIP